MEQEIILAGDVVEFNPFREQLATLAEQNNKVAFDYSTERGIKEAKSYIYKLRQSRAAIEKERKKAKEDSLNYGRKIDKEAQYLMQYVDSLIDVHKKPIDEIEERERLRQEMLESRINFFKEAMSAAHNLEHSDDVLALGKEIKSREIDDSFHERKDEAQKLKDEALRYIRSVYDGMKKAEDEMRELEQLRKEKEEADRIKREEEIAANATKEAEEKAAREQERIKREAQEAIEKANQDAEYARQKAEFAAAEERKKIEREQEEKRLADEARAANQEHRKAINRDVLASLQSLGVDDATARAVITAIVKGEVKHLFIQY